MARNERLLKFSTVILALLAPGYARAQPTPKFEVASIKPCQEKNPGAARPVPGRLTMTCVKASFIIQAAFANGRLGSLPAISGGPAWINTERYDVEAKAEGNPPQDTMYSMLQPVLEDRFKLKIHRESKEVPVYALTVAKGGPKLRQFKEGDCSDTGTSRSALPSQTSAQVPCGTRVVFNKGSNMGLEVSGATLDQFSKLLTGLDRPVIDKTGVQGRFDFRLEFAPDETTPGFPRSDNGTGPSIFTAIQEQLGLKLDSAKGSAEVLIIDHVERPSQN